MKKFFYDLLQRLDKLTGIKQWDKINAMPEPKKELSELLDILCRVCEQFPFIPEKDMQGILSHAVVADGEFIGLNAKFVYKHLALNKDKYFRELQHIPAPEEQGEPLTGEARQKALAEWLDQVNKMQTQMTVGEPTRHVPKEWENKGDYVPLSKQELFDREMHLDWIRANFDKNGDPVPGYLDEKTWVQQQLEKEV